MTILEKIIEQIEELDSADMISLNNAYCEANDYEDAIYDNDEDFFNTYFDGQVMNAVRAVSYGDYSYHHKYVKFNGNGNLDTMGSVDTDDLPDSVSVIAEYAIDNQRDFDMLDFDIEDDEDEDSEE